MSPSDKVRWSRAPVSALGLLISGQSPASNLVNHEGLGTPYVSGPEQWTGEQVVIDKWTTASAKIAPERSIFIVMKGAGVGTVFPGAVAAIGRDIAAFVPYEPLDREFILLVLRQQCKGIVGDARGHIPGLSRSMLLDIWLDVPPLKEQRRIAKKIRDAEGLLGRTRERLRTTRASASEVRASIFSDAFSGKSSEAWRNAQAEHTPDGPPSSSAPRNRRGSSSLIRGDYALALGVPPEPVPAGWAWSRLADIAELRTGHTPSRSEPDYWDGNIPWIGITDARENYGKIIRDTAQHITLAGLNNSSAEILPLNTICLSRTASLGYVVVTGAPMATSQDFLNWTCSDQLNLQWLLWLFIAEREGWQNFGRGSTHKTIYMEDAERLHILLPPLEEQREVVNFIEAGTRRVEAIILTIDNSEAAAISVRDETVNAALQGNLDTGDVRDENADLLLGRLEDDIQVTRAEPAADDLEDHGVPAISVDRLVDVVVESAEGLSPEKLFLSAGYRVNTVDIFFAHIKSAVAVRSVRYDAARDRVVTDET